jgi:hypothetical protein
MAPAALARRCQAGFNATSISHKAAIGKIAANVSRALPGMVNDSKGTETATLGRELGEEWRTMVLLLETVGVRAARSLCFDFVVSRWFAPNDHSMLEARIPRLTEGQVCRILTTALQDDKSE